MVLIKPRFPFFEQALTIFNSFELNTFLLYIFVRLSEKGWKEGKSII